MTLACQDRGDGAAGADARRAGVRVVLSPAIAEDPRLRALGLEAPATSPPDAFLIGEADGAFDLRPPGEHGRPGIQAELPPDRGPTGGRNPLVRAFGKRIDRILDLTAGLGGDAFRLARAGHRVTAIERDPALFALLESGWARARARGDVPEPVAARLELVWADARDRLAALAAGDRDDPGGTLGVYVDPMYPPPRRSSARPRRALQVLRALLGEQHDAADLVEAARPLAARVVVKRPTHARPLAPGASFEVESKLVRFDVYVNPARMQAGAA